MTERADGTPRWIADLLSWQWTWRLARVALVSAYLIGGVNKLFDFAAAVAEQQHFGLRPAWFWAVLAIVIEIGGSLLVVTGRLAWLGAGGLGVLTAVAMLVANDFWSMLGQDRFMAINTFFEHLGLIVGFVLVSIRAEEARP
jgi:uncharacterized membrane protein YphA (DoxX/SURF4 family)